MNTNIEITLLKPISIPNNPTNETIEQLDKKRKIMYVEFLQKKEIYKTYLQDDKEEEIAKLKNDYKELRNLKNNKALYEFTISINKDIQILNQLINDYNKEGLTIKNKVKLLNVISDSYKEIDEKYPESVIEICPEYREQFYNKLNDEIILNNKKLKENLLKEEEFLSNNQEFKKKSPKRYKYYLSELLEQMPGQKLSKFIEIMLYNYNYDDELTNLYQKNDPEYEEFNNFLKEHSITYEGGKNSNNFIIHKTKKDEDEKEVIYILKIENRLNQPHDISRILQNRVKNIVVSDFTKRNTCVIKQREKEQIYIRNITIQPLYKNNNLRNYSITKRKVHEKIDYALKIYSNMATILQNISKNNGAFTDMKNTNWLVDDNYDLWICDNKSLRMKNNNGNIDVFSENSRWYGDILQSSEYMPPELITNADNEIAVDPMHVYTFGKNIYEYLINIDTTDDLIYQKKFKGEEFNYNYPVFNYKPEGDLFRQLIIDTVQETQSNRISLQECLQRLEHIKLIRLARTKLSELKYNSIPNEVFQNCVNSVISLDQTKLVEYLNNLNIDNFKENINLFSNQYIEKYKKIFNDKFAKINIILAKCQNNDLKIAILNLKIEYQNLKLIDYEQFEADLESFVEEAEEVLSLYNDNSNNNLSA